MGQGDCAVCNTWGAKTCGVCKSTYYCSVECQIKDFPLHRLLCDKFIPFLEADEPTENVHKNGVDNNKPTRTTSKLAIRFPAKSRYPELIWLKCVKTKDESDAAMHNCEHSVTDSLSSFMAHPSGICYRPDRLQIFMDEGSNESNQCLGFLNERYEDSEQADRKDNQSRFRGDVVVAKIAVLRRIDRPALSSYESVTYANVTLADLRVAFHTLTRNNNYFNSPSPNPYFIRGPFPWMKAVKVREKNGHENSYHQVEVLRAMNIFDKKSYVDPISRRFGSDMSVKSTSVEGECVVSRKDGKDVTPQGIEDLVYHAEKLDDFMEAYTPEFLDKNRDGVALFHSDLLGLVFPDLEDVKEKKLKDKADWADDVCPRTIDLR